MTRTALRALLATLVVAALLAWFAPALEGGAKASDGVGMERFDAWLKEAPGNEWLIWAPRALAAVLGVFFLVQELLRPEKIRHGLLPAPDGLGPTVVATAGAAVGLAVGFFVLTQLAAVALFLKVAGDLRFSIAVTFLALLPPALLTTLRRSRLGAGRIPGAGAATAHGLRFTGIALLLVTPFALLWAVLLLQRGVDLEVQGPVEEIVRSKDAEAPWLITVFGVLLAPFNEEAVFRGLLYPSLRGRFPGGPLGAALAVSLLFAAIHGNLGAFLPLFVLSLVLCWVMERTNSLLACVIVHALHNAFSLLPMMWRHLHGALT